MTLDRFSIFRAMFPAKGAAADVAARWQRAFVREPALATDIIGLARILSLRPALFQDGAEVPEPIDPVRLAYEQGQRDLGVKFLALMGVTNSELAKLMEVDDAR